MPVTAVPWFDKEDSSVRSVLETRRKGLTSRASGRSSKAWGKCNVNKEVARAVARERKFRRSS